MKWQRGTALKSGEVNASVDACWAALTDWDAVLKCAPTREDGAPVELSECTLRDGHRLGTVPCTRIAVPVPIPGMPGSFEETLLYVDPVATFLYYNIEGESVAGLRNYLATTTLDALAPSRTRITCSSRFDLPEGVDVAQITGFLESVYEHWVINRIGKVAAAAE